jgi:hypothetical protein
MGYFLTGLRLPFLPSTANELINKLEPLVRYMGVNHRAMLARDCSALARLNFKRGLAKC